ncbi:proteasome inhibitor PI31 subunit-like [Anneissia japonica]|uniref:proteasome inhibitor PI31 subunit-like n=1 Tax=Anneissia japonica TaxID=1529436 RepID=UPI0014259472|nr:proteasome inhibitor PI31 subunit-like [Anneissia japonica]
MENFVGLEVLYAASNIRSKYDATVCFLHWCMLQNECKCKGLVKENVERKLSELLPAEWNKDNDLYSLMYQRTNDEVFTLKILRVEDTLLVNTQRMKDDKVSSCTVETSDFVNESSGWCYDSTYKNLHKLRKQFENSLKEIFSKDKSNVKVSTNLREESEYRKTRDQARAMHWHDPSPHFQHDPFSVGASDLDPFSSSSSGMFMDPTRSGLGINPLPNRMPRGSGIPGARFDPVGPAMNFQTPNPDHLPPPGFDDMYT